MAAKIKVRERIVNSAIDCFFKHGIEQTKLIDIAKHAKIGHPHVLYYFPTFDELAMAVIIAILEDLKNATVEAIESGKSDPEKLLKSYVYAPFIWAHNSPKKFGIWIHFYYKAATNEEFMKIDTKIREVGRDRIRAILYMCIAKGYCEKIEDSDMETLCIFIQGLITGNVIMAMTENGSRALEFAEITFKVIKNTIVKRSEFQER